MLNTIHTSNFHLRPISQSLHLGRIHPVRINASRQPLVLHAGVDEPPAVVITGASTGIGAATAEHMARNGWLVFAGVRSEEDADRIREANEELSIEPVMLDVTSPESIQKAVELVGNRVGENGLKGLVNNAGIGKRFGPVETMSIEHQKEVFDVNYFGVLRASQGFLPLLRKGGKGGRVINMGSLSGKLAFPMFGPYTASKHALEALSDCLRLELSVAGIQVALVEAGPIKTPIWEKALGTFDGVEKDMPEVQRAQYTPMMKAVKTLAQGSQENGVTTDKVVDVIQDALTSEKPRARYPVGDKIALQLFAKKMLPDRIFDIFIKRMIST